MAEEKEEKKEVKKEEKPEEKEEKKEEKEEKVEAKKEEKPEEKEEKKEVEIPAEFKDLVEKIEKMSVLDLSKLVKVLEEKFQVSATPIVSAQPVATGGAASAEGEEEKSSYDVLLAGSGGQKIPVIKVVRDLTGKGLKEAKDVVDQADQSPQVLKEGVKKEEAEEMKKKLEEAGAKVELK